MKENKFLKEDKESAGFIKVSIPGSKSISNRAILFSSMADGTSFLRGVLDSEDTVKMIGICRQLGAKIEDLGENTLKIQGPLKAPKEEVLMLHAGDSGTCARFLCGILTQLPGTYILQGSSQMRQRPMTDLVEVLIRCGADIKFLKDEGCLPIRIHSKKPFPGGTIEIAGNVSSQFVSSLLMIAPLTDHGMDIHIRENSVSNSYTIMTQSMMRAFGVDIQSYRSDSYFVPKRQNYQARDYKVSADASSASYFFALAAILGLRIEISGLEESPLQSDMEFANLLSFMGAELTINKGTVSLIGHPERIETLGQIDLNSMTDIVPTLAVVSMFAKGETHFHNIGHMRFKESDRIAALCKELSKLGAKMTEYQDSFSLLPPSSFENKEVLLSTYNDHRLAMAFSILRTRIPGILLDNEECVAKTFPGFFEELERVLQEASLQR